MTIKPEKEAEFVETMRAFVPKVHAEEPGTTLYALTKDESEPHTYVWLERYRDETAFEAHMQTPYMKEVLPKLGDWLAAPPQVQKLGQVLP